MIKVITYKDEQIHRASLEEYRNNYYKIIYLKLSHVFHGLSC